MKAILVLFFVFLVVAVLTLAPVAITALNDMKALNAAFGG